MRAGKFNLSWILAPASIGILVLLMPLLFPRERSLLTRSAKTLPVDDYPRWYAWSSNKALLLEWGVYDWTHYDCSTGKETQLEGLSARRIGPGGDIALSPDGKGLLEHTSASDGNVGQVLFSAVDGKRHFEQPGSTEEPGVEIGWLSDSQHWVELIGNLAPIGDDVILERILIHPLDKPDQAQTLSLAPTSLLGFMDRDGRLDFLTLEDRLIVSNCHLYNDAQPNQVHVVKLIATEPHLDISRTKTYQIVLPPNKAVWAVAYSPHGDKIAWLLDTEHVSPIAAFMHRFLPSVKVQTDHATACWVCNLDGTDMRKIGSIQTRPEDLESPLKQLRWLPDGKRLSFLYQDALWTVPAD